MSRFPSGYRLAVVLAVSVIASLAFAQDELRDLATFFGGHLTATGHPEL